MANTAENSRSGEEGGEADEAVPAETPVTNIDTQVQHNTMAETGTEKTTVNIRMTETFLDDVDETWTELGYNSRSEFIRDVLRDAIKHPEFNRADWKAIAAGEVEIDAGDTHTSEDVKSAFDLD